MVTHVSVFTCNFLLQTLLFLGRAKQLPMMSTQPTWIHICIDLALCLFCTIKPSQAFQVLLFHINDTFENPQEVLISCFIYFMDHYLINLLFIRENISGHQVIFYEMQVYFGDTEYISGMQRLKYELDLYGLALRTSLCFMHHFFKIGTQHGLGK